MSRFKTAAIDTDNVGSWVERRRKGRMVRKQHTVTGKWSPWMISPFTAPRAYNPVKVAEIASDAVDAAPNYQRMTVAELRVLAGDRGLKIPSKWRKADIIIALSESR